MLFAFCFIYLSQHFSALCILPGEATEMCANMTLLFHQDNPMKWSPCVRRVSLPFLCMHMFRQEASLDSDCLELSTTPPHPITTLCCTTEMSKHRTNYDSSNSQGWGDVLTQGGSFCHPGPCCHDDLETSLAFCAADRNPQCPDSAIIPAQCFVGAQPWPVLSLGS